MLFQLTRRTYRRWSQPGISDTVHAARSLFVPELLLLSATNNNTNSTEKTKKQKTAQSTGASIHDIIDNLRQFLAKKASAVNPRGQSIVLAGTCNLPKEMTNGYRGQLALPTAMQLDERILVFTGPENKEAALRCGADIVGGDELIGDVLEGRLQFDRVVATTDQLSVVTRLARFLGPKGMMPSAKTGTLTTDLPAALRQLRATVPFRLEKFSGIFNVPVAKTTMSDKQIADNVSSALTHIVGVGQSAVKKGSFIKQVHLVTHHGFTMQISPSEY